MGTQIYCKTLSRCDVKVDKQPDSVIVSFLEEEILCAVCKNVITSKRFRQEVQGKHCHCFFNPHGLIFEIGCFSQAPGVFCLPEKSAEFSWFPPYAWQISSCSVCKTHLGWKFSHEQDFFFGLILNRLIFPSGGS
ncbi:MAG: cereblon family protein [Desulfonauticus sp.]|nr:cereblon family protein [Desulfonauticus sp.]